MYLSPSRVFFSIPSTGPDLVVTCTLSAMIRVAQLLKKLKIELMIYFLATVNIETGTGHTGVTCSIN